MSTEGKKIFLEPEKSERTGRGKEGTKQIRRKGGRDRGEEGLLTASESAQTQQDFASILLFKLRFIVCPPSFLFPRWKRGAKEDAAALLPCLSGAAQKGDEKNEPLSKGRQIHRAFYLFVVASVVPLGASGLKPLLMSVNSEKSSSPERYRVSEHWTVCFF